MDVTSWLLIALVGALAILIILGFSIHKRRYRHFHMYTDQAYWEASYRGRKFKCGHKVNPPKIADAHNRFGFLTHGLKSGYCPDCVEEAIIECAYCGKRIYPEDPVVVYQYPPGDFSSLPAGAVVLEPKPELTFERKETPLLVVGCVREECAGKVQGDGRWIMPGMVDKLAGKASRKTIRVPLTPSRSRPSARFN